MYEKWINTLQSSLLFSDIGNESLNIMLDCLKPRIRRYKQREIIVTFGRPFQGVGIIAEGKISLIKETYSGNRTIMGILGTGDIFGETVAFSDNRVWPSTVIAHEDCTILFLPPDKITGACSNICTSHSTLIINMLRILSNRTSMLDRKIEHLSARNIRGKISSYLLEIYSQNNSRIITVPMKRHELADYLNIPRPSLSREMGLMRDAGIIDFNGTLITINDVLALEGSIN